MVSPTGKGLMEVQFMVEMQKRRVFRHAHVRKPCTLKRLKRWFQSCIIITYSHGNIPAVL
jgi:hypothetical protein